MASFRSANPFTNLSLFSKPTEDSTHSPSHVDSPNILTGDKSTASLTVDPSLPNGNACAFSNAVGNLILLIPCFSGEDRISVETFLDSVQLTSRLISLTEQQLLCVARLRLKGYASDYVRYNPHILQSFATFSKFLKLRFSIKFSVVSLERMFFSCFQNSQETVMEYSTRLRKIVFQLQEVYSDSTMGSYKSSLGNRHRLQFLLGLREEIGRFVQLRDPQTIAEAEELAILEEANIRNYRDKAKFVEDQSRELFTEIKCSNSYSYSRHAHGISNFRAKICFNCGNAGHLQRNCKLFICGLCGRKGHRPISCPAREASYPEGNMTMAAPKRRTRNSCTPAIAATSPQRTPKYLAPEQPRMRPSSSLKREGAAKEGRDWRKETQHCSGDGSTLAVHTEVGKGVELEKIAETKPSLPATAEASRAPKAQLSLSVSRGSESRRKSNEEGEGGCDSEVQKKRRLLASSTGDDQTWKGKKGFQTPSTSPIEVPASTGPVQPTKGIMRHRKEQLKVPKWTNCRGILAESGIYDRKWFRDAKVEKQFSAVGERTSKKDDICKVLRKKVRKYSPMCPMCNNSEKSRGCVPNVTSV